MNNLNFRLKSMFKYGVLIPGLFAAGCALPSARHQASQPQFQEALSAQTEESQPKVAAASPTTEDVSTTAPLVETTAQNLSMAEQLKASYSETDYVIGPEDVVEISVFRYPDLRMEAAVSPSGMIPYYLIGDIKAAGLTQFGLRDIVKAGLAKFIKNPEVVVRITQYQSHKVYVLGQVDKPGVQNIRDKYTLLEAISAAGGITLAADLRGAYVVRDGKVLLVNFFELIKKGNVGENIPLLAGDIIYIPDNKDQKVYVLGDVGKQSAIPMQENLTLLGAIAEAGGFTRDSEKGSIVILRGNISAPQVMKIDASGMVGTGLAANVLLRQGDIVYVTSTRFAEVERIAIRLSHILEPFLSVARGIIYTDAAVGVLQGGRSRLIVPD